MSDKETNNVESEDYIPVGDANLKYAAGRGFIPMLKNNWYYHKFHVLAILLAIIAIGLLVSQCLNKVEPDLSVLLCFSEPTSQQQRDSIQQELSKYTPDVNNDGMTYIQIVDTSYDANNPNTKLASNYAQKRFAELALANAFIIVSDDITFKQITTTVDIEGNVTNQIDFFTKQPFFNDKDNYAWNWDDTNFEEIVSRGVLPDDTYFSIRSYDAAEPEQIERYTVAYDVMNQLIHDNPTTNPTE